MATAKKTLTKSKISVVTASKSHPKTQILKSKIFNFFGNLKQFKPKSYTPVLAALLVIAAFLLGILITKVQYLEKGGSPTIVQNDQVGTTENTPPAAGQKVDVGVGSLPPQGDPNAKVKIIEFADFRCPFCERLYQESTNQIIEDYVKTGKAVLYFRHFAFLGPASVLAANATECANDQGKFWQMHNYLFDNQPPETDTSMYTIEKLTNAAGTLGMDTNKFNSCLTATTFQKNVDKDQTEGQTAGVSGTPTIFINGVSIVGAEPYANIKAQIDQELSK